MQAAQDAADEVVVGEAEEEGKLSITSIDTNTLATRCIACTYIAHCTFLQHVG